MIGHLRFFFSLPRREIWKLFTRTYTEWSQDDAGRLGAALAYYTLFSLAPLLLVLIAVAGLVFGEAAVRGQLVSHIEVYVGREVSEAVQAILQAAAKPVQGAVATVISLLTLLLGGSLVIVELRNSLNIVWNVRRSANEGGFFGGIMDLIQQRLFAFVLVLSMGLLVMISLIVNAFLAMAGKYFQDWLPIPELFLQMITFLVSFAVTTLLFALIYKVVPDVHIAWSDVIVGAAVTSLLFTGGKLLIALYLGKSSTGSAYGAAGSLVVLLAWVYYSAQIFFFGAEFTQAYANTYGSRFAERKRKWLVRKRILSPSTAVDAGSHHRWKNRHRHIYVRCAVKHCVRALFPSSCLMHRN